MRNALLAVLVLAAGVVVALLMVKLSPEAKRTTPKRELPIVETLIVEPQNITARVDSSGVVQAARKVQVVPQVSGKLAYVAPNAIPGGRLASGDVLARIEPREFELAIQQEQSRVDAAKLELDLEKNRQQIAEREWELLGTDMPKEASPLALRKRHLEVAEVNLQAARSALERSQLNLERTTLRAPFNATVVSESLDVGQVVAPGAPVATLVGTDSVWVTISIPVEDLRLVEVPKLNAEQGSRVVVRQRLNNHRMVEKTGRILRLVGELNQQTRRAELLAEVEQPFAAEGDGLPLLPGAFVEVEIHGKKHQRLYSVPRPAVHEGRFVWLVSEQNELVKRPVEIAFGTDEHYFVESGLEPSDRLVTSALTNPMEGIKVQLKHGANE